MAWQKVCTLINRSTDSCYAGTTRHPTFQDAEPFAKFLYQLSPIADIANCAEGDPEGCAWLAANLIPTSKAAKAIGKAADSVDELAQIGFRSNTSHIFRNAPGHLAEDTAENRALIKSALDPANLRQTDPLKDGTLLYRYFRILPDGTQVWAEVRNGEITNGGLNDTPR
ncbi:hypothetical protein SacmaDRAFT_3826 [Saccharomonospora marina XMU15]|uniref:Uncharacterized protein n=1 Tax=Saccharomonospora marina XMU15 TaxID=882083 RepID=H5X1W2_9PSEU|nr:hypothetical protein [Saccharomonospora marina]EHR52031.1 hypothetical protein SacmaDRAFT_3826 [Saccharomonospora marina XMU15]